MRGLSGVRLHALPRGAGIDGLRLLSGADSRRPVGVSLILASGQLVAWGVLYYSFGVVLVPMVDELGWSLALASGGFSAALVVAGLAAPLVGTWIDEGRGRVVMSSGLLLGAAAVAAWASATRPLVLLLVFGAVGLAMAATLYEPAVAVAAQLEDEAARRRSIVVITVVGGFATTVFTPLAALLVDRLGWRVALVLLAVLLASLAPMQALALPPRSARVPQTAHGESVTRVGRPAGFPRLTAAITLHRAVSVAASVHLVAFLLERSDSLTGAAAVAGTVGLVKPAARLLAGTLVNRVRAAQLLRVAVLVQAGGLVGVLLLDDPLGTALLVTGLGAGTGAASVLQPLVFVDQFDPRRFARLAGEVTFLGTLPRALAPLVVGAVATATGTYGLGWAGMGVASVLAALLLPTGLSPADPRG